MKIIESFTGFQPLEEVWIGGVYPTSFYKHLPNQVEDAYCYITEITNETFGQLYKKLVELNVTTHRPFIDDNIDLYLNTKEQLIKPPVCPRDWVIALGNSLYVKKQGYKKEPFQKTIDHYLSHGEDVKLAKSMETPFFTLNFPGIVRIGSRLVIENYSSERESQYSKKKHPHKNYFLQKAIQQLKSEGYEIIITEMGGHSDAIFCPVREGYILSSHWGDPHVYQKTLPGWKIFWVEDNRGKRKKNGRWWQPEDKWATPAFNEHVQEYVKEWTGDSRETIFSVNMLVIDEKNVICQSEPNNDSLFTKIESLGIKLHVIDCPARNFWDGGFHCMTADIRRRGGCLNYFNNDTA